MIAGECQPPTPEQECRLQSAPSGAVARHLQRVLRCHGVGPGSYDVELISDRAVHHAAHERGPGGVGRQRRAKQLQAAGGSLHQLPHVPPADVEALAVDNKLATLHPHIVVHVAATILRRGRGAGNSAATAGPPKPAAAHHPIPLLTHRCRRGPRLLPFNQHLRPAYKHAEQHEQEDGGRGAGSHPLKLPAAERRPWRSVQKAASKGQQVI